jgi:alpha/beta superfamily hydrolase
MAEPILLSGGRDARGALDVAAAGSERTRNDADPTPDADSSESRACVVACPPHPQHGGHRGDPRLRAVSDELLAVGVDCLRFDYGAWDGGRGERTDALAAVAWAGERYDRVALFGYSFGGAIALSSAAHGADVAAVAALAPIARTGSAREETAGEPREGSVGGVDAVADIASIPDSIPIGVFYGDRDDGAAIEPIVEVARRRGAAVTAFDADHAFVGQEREVAGNVAGFLAPALQLKES